MHMYLCVCILFSQSFIVAAESSFFARIFLFSKNIHTSRICETKRIQMLKNSGCSYQFHKKHTHTHQQQQQQQQHNSFFSSFSRRTFSLPTAIFHYWPLFVYEYACVNSNGYYLFHFVVLFFLPRQQILTKNTLYLYTYNKYEMKMAKKVQKIKTLINSTTRRKRKKERKKDRAKHIPTRTHTNSLAIGAKIT